MSACPACDYFGSTVVMTRRLQGGWIKRWRRCNMPDCGHRWQTFEIPTTGVDTDRTSPDLLEIKRAVTEEVDG